MEDLSITTNESITIPPKKGEIHENTLIFLQGINEDITKFWKEYFLSYETRFIPPSTKVLMLFAPCGKIDFFHKDNIRRWYNWIISDLSIPFEQCVVTEEYFGSAKKIAGIVEKESEIFNNDYKKIFLCGFSQGCTMALQVGMDFHHILGGVIGFSSYINPICIKLDNLDKGLKIFMGQGDADKICTMDIVSKYNEKLLKHHNVEYHVYKGLKHKTCEEEFNDVKEFFLKCIR